MCDGWLDSAWALEGCSRSWNRSGGRDGGREDNRCARGVGRCKKVVLLQIGCQGKK